MIFGDLAGGHVGPPLPGCEIKLADVPDMDLVASRDKKGEVGIYSALVNEDRIIVDFNVF